MDYKEYMVKRKKGAAEMLLAFLIYLVALALSFASLVLIKFGGFGLLLSVGFIYAGYKLCASFNREFEYIVTDDFVDVDVIFNASRRKRLITFSMKDAEIIAPVDSPEYKSYAQKDYKVIDASTRRKDAKVYFAAVEKNGKKLVKIELPEEALLHLRKYAPSKVVM